MRQRIDRCRFAPLTVLQWERGDDECCGEEDDRVFVHSSWFLRIMGRPYKDMDYRPSRRPVLRIRVKHGSNRRTVFRLVTGRSASGLGADTIALGRLTMHELGVSPNQNYQIQLKRSIRLAYLWNHPAHTLRGPYRVALILGEYSGETCHPFRTKPATRRGMRASQVAA